VELGRTVEKYSNTCNHKRAAHHFNPAYGIVGLLKNINTCNHKEQHITLIPAHRWELGRTVEKYSNTCNHKKSSTSLFNPCFIGGLGRTVEKYS
jgi:hypothetical protein